MFPIAEGRIAAREPGRSPASWVVTGRQGGVSGVPFDSLNLADHVGDSTAAVAINRGRVATALGLAPARLAVMAAVHGSDVAYVSQPGIAGGVDALVTQESDLAILALGADCVPVALIGDDDRTLAVAHCGWRGLVADVAGAVVAEMAARGSGVAAVVMGPAVCGDCYPVPEQRAAAVARAWEGPVARSALVTCADGQPGIDVRRGLIARFDLLGVPAESVLVIGGCTVEDAGLFSHRRDQVTGRQGVAVCRRLQGSARHD